MANKVNNPNSQDAYVYATVAVATVKLELKDLEGARKDLEMAAKLAPEMLDAHYHLGLSHYFVGDFKRAAVEFDRARALAKTDDSLIDRSNWLYVSLRRAGDQTKAAAVLTTSLPLNVIGTAPS